MALATSRFVGLVGEERGPYAIFERLRARVRHEGIAVHTEPVNHPNPDDGGRTLKLQYLMVDRPTPDAWGEAVQTLDCPFCLSIWAGVAVLGLAWAAPWAVRALALSEAAIHLDAIYGRVAASQEPGVDSGHGASAAPDVAPD